MVIKFWNKIDDKFLLIYVQIIFLPAMETKASPLI